MNTRIIIPVLMLLAAVPLAAEDEETPIMDRLVLTDGKRKTVQVVEETLKELVYRNIAGTTNQSMPWSMIQAIEYDGMASGYYQAAMGMRAEANFDSAAEHFLHLATNGKREWERAYGQFYAGQCLELAGRYEAAAAKFGAFCTAHPRHRWWVDAKYYEGINLARQEKKAAAEETVKQLMAYQEVKENRIHIGRRPEIRANAISAVLLAIDNKMLDAIMLQKRVRFGQGEEELSYHWDNFWAYFLLEKQKYEGAVQAFKDLQKKAAGDPIREAESSVGYGIALAESGDQNGALMQFLKLDILPYGTPKQRCLAQYWAGKLLWTQAKENAAKADKASQDLATVQRQQCQLLLKSCMGNPTSLPEREKAGKLLDQYFPPPAPPTPPAVPGADPAKTPAGGVPLAPVPLAPAPAP
jgi:TolA-binding protein